MERKYQNRSPQKKLKSEEYIFGIRAVIEAIESGKEINKLLLQRNSQGELFKTLNEIIRDLDFPVQKVPIQKLNTITRKNHQGVIALVAPIEYSKIEHVLPQTYEQGKTPFFCVLDGITDVRNMGAIARSAECNGVHGIIVPTKGSAEINADAIKTSAGALSKLPVCREFKLKETIRYLKDSGIKIIGCTEKAEKPIFSADLSGPIALIVGNEEKGISSENLSLCDDTLKIPMYGTVQSLNVAVSASIMMYEVNRQRAKNEV